MVYRQTRTSVRHAAWPLRLGPRGTDAVVERHGSGARHFDAYRFFTPPAAPLNVLRPTRGTQPALEQPGCLHADDGPLQVGVQARARWSPRSWSRTASSWPATIRGAGHAGLAVRPGGPRLSPVRIETPEGKAEYVAAQRGFAERAAVLRARLLDLLDRLAP